MSQRGFSLLEAIIVAAIVATIAAFFFSASVSSEPAAEHSALAQFDAALAYARAAASVSGSAAMLFTSHNTGTEISVAGAPPFEIDAAVRDATIGPAPFTVVLNAAGHASGPGCPPGGWSLTFRSGSGVAVKPLACRQ